MTQALRLGALLGLLALPSSSVGAQILPEALDELSSGGGAVLGDVTVDSLTVTGAGDVSFTVGAYTSHVDLDAFATGRGSTAPTETIIGTSKFLTYDADAETSFLSHEIPFDWDQISDLGLVVMWVPEVGDPVADGETAKFDISWRAQGDGESATAGSVVTQSVTLTQVGVSVETEILHTTFVLDFDNVTQPISTDDHMMIQFNRDVTGDTYSGAVNVQRWRVEYQSVGLPIK